MGNNSLFGCSFPCFICSVLFHLQQVIKRRLSGTSDTFGLNMVLPNHELFVYNLRE